MTFNLTEDGAAAPERLPGRDRTDALTRTLRLADSRRQYTVDGVLLAQDSADGQPVQIHIT
ncbi:hypothetical protein AAH979_30565 [Plantactinospora sp. ZYX-F-223]|uniref:hypothetical protein n=1 Tax=Plantactinospora sp. ZYX-F-223 TaxID=3144103 RepID=UPI0031FDFB3B